jgi:hypothetical protein
VFVAPLVAATLARFGALTVGRPRSNRAVFFRSFQGLGFTVLPGLAPFARAARIFQQTRTTLFAKPRNKVRQRN